MASIVCKMPFLGSLVLLAPFLFFSGNSRGADLLDVYEKAVENDAQIREARYNRNAAQDRVPLARSQLLPDLSLGGIASRIDVEPKATGDGLTYSNAVGVVRLTQPVFHRDRWVTLKQSKSQAAEADAVLTADEQDLIVRVSQAYFDILGAEDTLTYVRADKTATARELEQAKRRYKVGLDAITSVDEARARYDIVAADEVTAEFDLSKAWQALRRIIGERPETLARLIGAIPLKAPSPASEDDWSAWAQQNNPTIQAAQHNVEAAKQQIEIQRSGHYPTLDLVGSYQVSRYRGVPERAGSQSLVDADGAAIGLELNIPIL